MDVWYVYWLGGAPYVVNRVVSVFEHVGLHHIEPEPENPPAELERLAALDWSRESVIITSEDTWDGALFRTGSLRLPSRGGRHPALGPAVQVFPGPRLQPAELTATSG